MPQVPFASLPEDARLWIFPVQRPLTPPEEARLLDAVDAFVRDWAAHGRPLTAARDWRHGRFLLVAVDEATAPPSGCSIDSMANLLKEVGEEMGVELMDHGPVWYRRDGEVRKASRTEFGGMARDGTVDTDTPVFDNTITRKGELEEGWEKPAGASWHRRAFF